MTKRLSSETKGRGKPAFHFGIHTVDQTHLLYVNYVSSVTGDHGYDHLVGTARTLIQQTLLSRGHWLIGIGLEYGFDHTDSHAGRNGRILPMSPMFGDGVLSDTVEHANEAALRAALQLHDQRFAPALLSALPDNTGAVLVILEDAVISLPWEAVRDEQLFCDILAAGELDLVFAYEPTDSERHDAEKRFFACLPQSTRRRAQRSRFAPLVVKRRPRRKLPALAIAA
jgi:hypothetical protein